MLPRTGCSRLASAALLALGLAVAVGARADPIDPNDPVVPLYHDLNRFFHANEVDGVVIDRRIVINRTEAIRLSVISQLLGYVDLYHAYPRASFRRDVIDRADYLVANFEEVRSGSTFDGMLGYALLGAYDVAGNPAYLEKGTAVVNEILALPPSETVLNGGLMGALATAKHYRMTGSLASARRTQAILAGIPPYQNADGSFPHWCPGSTDVHYTGWMAMELILIGRMMNDPMIEPTLERMRPFLEGRIDAAGHTRYEEPCEGVPGCTVYYYSIASGCSIDYDTRAFTNELGYTALLFDHFGSPRYRDVMGFLRTLEHDGAIADKWDFWPPPDDPYYVWTAADTSVVNMSVLFWSVASLIDGRESRVRPDLRRLIEEDEPPGAASRTGPRAELDPVAPQPARGGCELAFELGEAAPVSLSISDVTGRRIREVAAGEMAQGAHRLRWDGRDSRGTPCPPGLYFASLKAPGVFRTRRIVLER